MNKRTLLVALLLPVYLMAAGCSSTPDADPTSSQGTVDRNSGSTEPGTQVPEHTPKVDPRPSNAKVPTVETPLESHPGDEDNFYVDTDDYIVWAEPSTHTKADREYRVVSFESNGQQSSAFLKYVFSDETGAKEFAETSDLLILVGNVVYYQGWLGPERRDKAGVIELAQASGNEYYISMP